MDNPMSIIDIMRMISEGIDPLTGEVFDIDTLKNEPKFQEVLKELYRKYRISRNRGNYARFEGMFPKHAIIMKEGCFFAAHNESALVMKQILGYQIGIDYFNRLTTGGPDYEVIAKAFQKEGISYILIEYGNCTEQHEGVNPFDKYAIRKSTDIVKNEDSKEHCLPNEKKTRKEDKRKSYIYPINLLNDILPEQTEYPEDIENRIETVLLSTAVFPGKRRRDADCMRAYYKEGLTQAEIGNTYELTRERIRQLILRAKRKLQRPKVLAYLKGETDFLDYPSINSSAPFSEAEKSINGISESIPEASNEALSISGFARSMAEQTKKEFGKTFNYADISSWLVNCGDLVIYEIDGKKVAIPTDVGVRHGLIRGIGKNVKGTKYVGLFLEKAGQEYIIENLNNIIAYINSLKEKTDYN